VTLEGMKIKSVTPMHHLTIVVSTASRSGRGGTASTALGVLSEVLGRDGQQFSATWKWNQALPASNTWPACT
jgi:hypothetical protein